jgi:outer membrane protein
VTAGTDAIVTLGGGARVQPSFDGASTYLLSPMPIVSLKFLRSPFTGQPTSDTGFGFFPSFRFYGERKGVGKLAGLNTVSAAAEAGFGVDYTDTYWRAFVEVRQGFGGEHGQTADLGLDGIFRPIDRLKLAAGPRLSLASTDYMRTYFGVTAAETVASGGKFGTFRPGGGVRGVGLGGTATYDIDPHWVVEANAGWTHLVGDAASSPIVRQAGSREQFTVGLGVAYRFGVGWH